MSRNILVALMHPEEWNQYTPFNGYISTIKQDYDHVIGVVAEKPLILLSEADEYYTMENGDSDLSYPKLLDTKNRENHFFINSCIDKIKEDFPNDNLKFISWQDTSITKGIVDIRGDATKVYVTSFKYAQEWYKTKKLIRPTVEVYNKINSKYEHLFNDNTFILLSRNFKTKSTIHNTKNVIPNFESMVSYLVENGVKIINIGFPVATCNIDNENYIEIEDSLTQEELISLFYLSKGVLSQACSGGIVSHLSSNADFFTLTNQWNNWRVDSDVISYRTKDVDTIQLLDDINDFDKILNILINYKPKKIISFQDSKKITYAK